MGTTDRRHGVVANLAAVALLVAVATISAVRAAAKDHRTVPDRRRRITVLNWSAPVDEVAQAHELFGREATHLLRTAS